ncbi:MAG: hypothetical protein ACOC0P_02025 [Planctomycetota bacterium]
MTARHPEIVDELPSMLERHNLIGVLEPADIRSETDARGDRLGNAELRASSSDDTEDGPDEFDLVALRQRLRAGASTRVSVRSQPSVHTVAATRITAGHCQ